MCGAHCHLIYEYAVLLFWMPHGVYPFRYITRWAHHQPRLQQRYTGRSTHRSLIFSPPFPPFFCGACRHQWYQEMGPAVPFPLVKFRVAFRLLTKHLLPTTRYVVTNRPSSPRFELTTPRLQSLDVVPTESTGNLGSVVNCKLEPTRKC